jgi:parallel beta-helix repeat protein
MPYRFAPRRVATRSVLRTPLASIVIVTTAVFGAVIAASSAYAAGTTLYVGGPGCSPDGPGSPTQPYCTINQAAAVAMAGDTVLVAGGTYTEKVTVPRSGMAGNPIVFRPASSAPVTVTGAANGFFVSGQSYVTIQGFAVTATTSFGIYLNNSSNIVIANNTVTNSGHALQGSTAAGIELAAVTASTVSGNTSDHNSDHGIFLNSSSSGNLISYNEASFNAEQWQRNANGINVTGSNNSIIGNVTHDNEDSGLQFYPGGNNGLAALNVTYNNGDHGIDDLNVTGGRLIGNTVYHNCTSGINVEGTGGNYTVENNVAVDNGVFIVHPTPINYTILHDCQDRRDGDIAIWDSAPPTTTIDNNLVYLSTGTKLYAFGSTYTSLVAVRNATGQEQHGVQLNPNFANASAGNFQLTEGSPAIDAANSGVSGEQPNDIRGVPRSDDLLVPNNGTGPELFNDVGAYEFISTGSPQPPTAALSMTPTNGNAPLAVTADASASTDPQGQTLTYTFNFGDGTTVGPQAGATANHTYTTVGTYTAKVTVTDTANLTATTQQTVTVAGGATNPAFVNQIATNYSTTAHSSGSITVWRTEGVVAGDVEILTVQLTGAGTTGSFSGIDDSGNVLTVAEDVSDGSGDRFAVLYGIVHTALGVNAKITVTYPGSAASYRIVGDEVSGVTAVDKAVGAAGTTGAYSSAATGTTTSSKEFVFGAVGVFAGTTPSWTTGWTSETTYAVGTNYLGRSYKITTSPGSFTATGTASGSWIATCVTFR